MTDKTNELKPCPFCGSDAHLHESDEYWYVACSNCINQTTHFFNGKDVVIERWNRRYDHAAADWIPIDEYEIKQHSLQWLLIENRNGERGIRLGLPEESGWRIINEYGDSSWMPKTLGVIAAMPLVLPVDVPYTAPADSGEREDV